MDYSDGVKYYFFRLLLLFGTNAIGLVLGKAVFWVIASVLPFAVDPLKQFLVSDVTGSIAASAVMILLLGLVFHDDAKKHAAYDDMDMILVTVVLILLMAVYFVPIIFYNPSDITRLWSTVYYMFYYPCRWVIELTGAQLGVAAIIGMAVILGAQFVIYQMTYVNYKRKHPFIFKHSDDDDDSGELSEM